MDDTPPAHPVAELWPAALFVAGFALPVLDGTPDASAPVRCASIALLLAASAAHGARWWGGRGALPGVTALGAAALAAIQVRLLLA